MASASSVREFKCSICLETYKQPKKLPGCSHSFCETCIVTFIDKLKTEDKLGLEFQCPVCRLPSKAPEDQDVICEWVKKMDRDNELESRTQGQVEDTQGEYCSPCKYLNKTNVSKYYCLNCEEYQCEGCSGILHASKQNRNHIIIETKSDKSERFHKPSLELMAQLLTCSEHSKSRIEFYCEDHSQTACYKCATVNHRSCRNLKEVKEIPQFTLKSVQAKVSKSVTTQVEYIQCIINAYKQNEDQNKINTETICTEMQTIKQNVVKLLDALEDNLKQSSSAIMKNANLRHLEEIEDLKHMLQQLNVMDYLIKSCLTSATPDQVFVCMEGLKKISHDSEKRVIEKEKAMKTKEVCLKVNDMLTSILRIGPNDTTQLGTIEEKESAAKLAKYRKPYEIKKVDSRCIVPQTNKTDPTYNDLLYLPNNDLLLVDSYHGYCCLVNDTYIERASRIFVSSNHQNKNIHYRKLQYAAYLENGTVVVSMCMDKKVCLASSDDLSAIGTTDCKYNPTCMVGLDNNAVAIAWDKPVAFGIIEIQNNTYSDKVYFAADNGGRQLKSFDHMAVDKDLRHVIQPCNVDKAVYCFSFSGNPVFTYKVETLKEPRGVTVDYDSNVYICDQEGAGIHVVSPSGVAIKVIKDGCPEKPLAISFSLKGDTFAVSEYANNWKRIHFFALVPGY